MPGDKTSDRFVVDVGERELIFTNSEDVNDRDIERGQLRERFRILNSGNHGVSFPILHPVRSRVSEATRSVKRLPVRRLPGIAPDPAENFPTRPERGFDEQGDTAAGSVGHESGVCPIFTKVKPLSQRHFIACLRRRALCSGKCLVLKLISGGARRSG